MRSLKMKMANFIAHSFRQSEVKYIGYRSSKLHHSAKCSSKADFVREVSKHRKWKDANKPRRVVVTGAGCISPLGNDVENVYKKCLNEESGIKSVKTYYVVDELGKNWAEEYQKHGIHNISFIDEGDRKECQSFCEGQDRVKSEAMKFAEFAAMKALENVRK